MTATLEKVLAEIATANACRAHNGTRDGGLIWKCSGEPELVTLACEHEHFYEAALCREHQDSVSKRTVGCPLCRAGGDEFHQCRHAVVQS